MRKKAKREIRAIRSEEPTSPGTRIIARIARGEKTLKQAVQAEEAPTLKAIPVIEALAADERKLAAAREKGRRRRGR